MAGYSRTPLGKKFGIKPEQRVALDSVPADITAVLKDALGECKRAKTAPLDFVLACASSRVEVKAAFKQWSKSLAPAGMLWIGWPKKSSGIATNVSEDIVRDIGLAAGLVDVKVCAISDMWSGLKFVIRVKDRPKR